LEQCKRHLFSEFTDAAEVGQMGREISNSSNIVSVEWS